MPLGTLTIHQAFGSLVGLAAVARISLDPIEAVYATVGSPTFRVVFALDPGDPTLATSFVVMDASGALYAEAEYGVSLSALEAALAGADPNGVLAAIFGGLTTLKLGQGADVDLVAVKPDLTMAGNDLGTHFTAELSPATITAGGGDDEIVLHVTFGPGHIDGGEGSDTLWLVDAVGDVNVLVAGREIVVEHGLGGPQAIRTFSGIEFFRGSAATEKFAANGEGMRFEGGAGGDQFLRLGGDPFTDIVDYGGETGTKGVVVNLGQTLDPTDLSALEGGLAAALVAVLASNTTVTCNGFSLDTFGDVDLIDPGFVIEGTSRADFFYGSNDADAFEGDGGDDHFFGGSGDDTVKGGEGDDTFHLSLGEDFYDVVYDAGVFTIAGDDGTDTVSGVETLSFAGALVAASSFAPSAPVAADDDNALDPVIEAAGVTGDGTATGDVLANDDDADGDMLTVIEAQGAGVGFAPVGGSTVIAGTYGSLVISDDGNWTYTLNDLAAATNALRAGQTALDTFTYRIGDGALEDEATLTIAIAGGNDAPAAPNKVITIAEDGSHTFAASDFGFSDPDTGDTLQSVTILSLPGGGTLKLGGVPVAAGQVIGVGLLSQLVFTPSTNANGSPLTSFGFTVSDGVLESAAKTVTIHVTAANDPPIAGNDSGLVTAEDTPLTIAAAALLANDSDAEGNALTIASVSGATGGTVALNADGTVTFTPLPNHHGQASFSYRAEDSTGAVSAAATVVMSVTPVNDAPAFAGIGPSAALAVLEGASDVYSPLVSDPDSTTLTYSLEGSDADDFVLEGNILRFALPADFEAPRDSDGDNIYDVTLVVSDGVLSDSQALAISVLNSAGATVEGTSTGDKIDMVNRIGPLGATGEEDAIDGKGGNDTIKGAGGNDSLRGDVGNDALMGDAGNDLIRGGVGKDELDGGADVDTADYSDKRASVVLTLNGSTQAVASVGGTLEDKVKNVENITGGSRSDTLTGDTNINVLKGGAGDDILDGAKGNDSLDGGKGNDAIIGGLGIDALTGGAGHDAFVFNAKLGAANIDAIADFVHNADAIHLDDAIFKAVGPTLEGKEFYAAAGAVTGHDRNDRIVYDNVTGKLYYDADGSKSGAAIHFATLSTKPMIDAGDFLVV